MARQPIHVEAQPPAVLMREIRDEMRQHSLVYEHLLAKFGLGEAERWIEALAWGHNLNSEGPRKGWYLYASNASERIAKQR